MDAAPHLGALELGRKTSMTTSSPELTTRASHGEQVKQQLQKGSETVRDKVGEATLQATSAANEALAKLPTAVSGRVEQLAETARHRPVPVAAVLLGVLVLLVLPLVLRRNK